MRESGATELSEVGSTPSGWHRVSSADWQSGLVSVILVNWNGERYIEKCLESVRRQTWTCVEIILIDNASTDRSLELAGSFKDLDITVLRNGENLGFAVASNQGIQVAKGEFVMFLNLDAHLHEQYIESLVTALQSDSGLGSATGKLYQLRYGAESHFIDSAGICVLTSRECLDRGQGQKDAGQFDRSELVFGASAAAGLYRRETLEALAFEGEYLDNAFQMYKEDVDLAWRSLLCGWECLYVPTAIGWHERGGSTVRLPRYIDVHSFKNRYLMVLKNDRLPDLLLDIIPITIFNMIDWIKMIRWPYLGAAIPQILRVLPRILRWRRVIKSARRAEPDVPRRYFQSSRGMIRRRWTAWRESWR